MFKLEPAEWYKRDQEQRDYYMYEAITSIAESLNGIATSLAAMTAPKPDEAPAPVDWLDVESRASALALRTQYNEDHAAELFGDKLSYNEDTGRWFDKETLRNVIFTGYGWRIEE